METSLMRVWLPCKLPSISARDLIRGWRKACEENRRRRTRDLPASGNGFTLIEIVVVVIILGLLVGLVGPQIVGRVGQSRVQTARAQIEMLATQLDLYRLDNSAYPTTEQGLNALWGKPTTEPVPKTWRGPYSRKAIPLDPWGEPYVYRHPGVENPNGFDLASLGADGRSGGEDEAADIMSWER
jgi:general secretion pathway protein G